MYQLNAPLAQRRVSIGSTSCLQWLRLSLQYCQSAIIVHWRNMKVFTSWFVTINLRLIIHKIGNQSWGTGVVYISRLLMFFFCVATRLKLRLVSGCRKLCYATYITILSRQVTVFAKQPAYVGMCWHSAWRHFPVFVQFYAFLQLLLLSQKLELIWRHQRFWKLQCD